MGVGKNFFLSFMEILSFIGVKIGFHLLVGVKLGYVVWYKNGESILFFFFQKK